MERSGPERYGDLPAPPEELVPPPPPVDEVVPPPTGEEAPHRWASWRFSQRWVAAAISAVAVLIVAAAGGFAYGYFTGPDGGPEVPSPDQSQVLAEFGPPPEFLLTDGPINVDAPFARVEVWGYPEADRALTFLDGTLVDRQPIGGTGRAPASAYSPVDFHRSQRKGDVEELLGEWGTPLPETDTVFDGLESYAYESARLLISYLDGWLLVVQTY